MAGGAVMMNKAVESYLAIRRTAGFDLKSEEFLLHSFARFASARQDKHVNGKTALEWAALSSTTAERARRLQVIVRFARHLRTEDNRHEIPPAGFFPNQRRRTLPYIFSQSEIIRLIEQALRLGPDCLLKPHTYATLFALLSVTGLRISEALALKLNDITPDGLVVRKTKFRKSRLLPLHKTVVEGLERYLVRRLRLAVADDHLFVSPNGARLGYHTVRRVFLGLVQAAKIEIPSNRSAPHIHWLSYVLS
jgi:integrase